MPETYVLEIELPGDSQKDLREILDELGLSGEKGDDLGEAIGTALSTQAFLLKQAAHGAKVMIIDKHGRQRELLVKEGGIASGGRADHR